MAQLPRQLNTTTKTPKKPLTSDDQNVKKLPKFEKWETTHKMLRGERGGAANLTSKANRNGDCCCAALFYTTIAFQMGC